MGTNDWRLSSKCKNLSPYEADELFFPDRGGKSKKADRFCSNCPVLDQCLRYAIENDLDGFFAGETRESRRTMSRFMGILIRPIVVEEPVKKRRVYRKIINSSDTHEWLDKVEGPTEEQLQQETPILESTGVSSIAG